MELSDIAPVELSMDYRPCDTPTEGMVCIPGGPAIVGTNTGSAYEKPQQNQLTMPPLTQIEPKKAEHDDNSTPTTAFGGLPPARFGGNRSVSNVWGRQPKPDPEPYLKPYREPVGEKVKPLHPPTRFSNGSFHNRAKVSANLAYIGFFHTNCSRSRFL